MLDQMPHWRKRMKHKFWRFMAGFAGHRFLGNFYMTGRLSKWRHRLLVHSERKIGLRATSPHWMMNKDA